MTAAAVKRRPSVGSSYSCGSHTAGDADDGESTWGVLLITISTTLALPPVHCTGRYSRLPGVSTVLSRGGLMDFNRLIIRGFAVDN